MNSQARAGPPSPLGLGAGAGFLCSDCSVPWLSAAAQLSARHGAEAVSGLPGKKIPQFRDGPCAGGGRGAALEDPQQHHEALA